MSHADETHPHHGIDYVEIPVPDLAAAKAFFGAAFGWRFNDYGPAYAGYVDGARGEMEAGGLAEQETVTPGGVLVVLYSDSLEASLASVEAAGGTITEPIFDFPGGRRFHFAAPGGIEMGVWSPPR